MWLAVLKKMGFVVFYSSCIFFAMAQKNTHTFQRVFEANWQKYITNGAGKYHPSHPMFFKYIDSALIVYPDDAFLYQQKAISYYKLGKFAAADSAMQIALKLDTTAYIHYFGFVKTIFEKDYKAALPLLQYNTNARPYIADHSPVFYQGLCYLKTGNYTAAENCFNNEIAFEEGGIVHFMNYFYLAICYIEMQQYEKAIPLLDSLLERYPSFSELYFYRALIAYNKGDYAIANSLFEKALKYFDAGYTITEENAIYERYPYQLVREQAAFYFEKTKPKK